MNTLLGLSHKTLLLWCNFFIKFNHYCWNKKQPKWYTIAVSYTFFSNIETHHGMNTRLQNICIISSVRGSKFLKFKNISHHSLVSDIHFPVEKCSEIHSKIHIFFSVEYGRKSLRRTNFTSQPSEYFLRWILRMKKFSVQNVSWITTSSWTLLNEH